MLTEAGSQWQIQLLRWVMVKTAADYNRQPALGCSCIYHVFYQFCFSCVSCVQVVCAGSELPPCQASTAAAAAAAGGVTPAPSSTSAAAAAAGGGVTDAPWPLLLQLSNGDCLGVDLLVQAIGVEPATDWLPGKAACQV
jgi:hypothetical protein